MDATLVMTLRSLQLAFSLLRPGLHEHRRHLHARLRVRVDRLVLRPVGGVHLLHEQRAWWSKQR